jgi:TIR domain
VTEFEDQEVDFHEADRRYAEIKQRHEVGTLTDKEFDEQLKQLMVQDQEDRWWVKSRTTGEWHYYDGTAWIKDTPPGYEPIQAASRVPSHAESVFISYRRDESAGYAGRIADRFEEYFGEDKVFRDIDSLELGLDFSEAIERALESSEVLVAVIGKNWLTATDAAGQRRLENPDDFVRVEIATALKRNMRVIPVLVQGASMPDTDELPEDLAPLTRRNAFELHDTGWSDDIRRLITVIERVIKGPSVATPDEPEVKRPSKKLLWWAAGGILMLAVIASLYGLYQITQITNSPPDGKLSDIAVNYDDKFFYVNFKAEIEGYPAGEKCEVRWTMYDAKTQEKLPGPKFQDQMYIYPDRYWTKSLAIRVPTPEEPGDYYVKLELFAPDKSGESKPLDVEKSETTQIRAFKFELG